MLLCLCATGNPGYETRSKKDSLNTFESSQNATLCFIIQWDRIDIYTCKERRRQEPKYAEGD